MEGLLLFLRIPILRISGLAVLLALSACGGGDSSNAPGDRSNGPGTGTSIKLFPANDGANGIELWKTNGSAAGTVMVKDINTLAGASSSPNGFTEFNGAYYFQADDGVNGMELWKTDGTAAGTLLVKDINDGGSSSPQGFAVLNGVLYFSADDGVNGTEVWKTDGSAAGTVMVKDINTSPTFDLRPSGFTAFNGAMYFQAYQPATGSEVWKTDGTAEGTVMVKDINIGSEPGASSFPASFTVFNGALYFRANNGSARGNGFELWKTDGTSAGTVMVKDIEYQGPGSSFPHGFTIFNGALYFQATQDVTSENGQAPIGAELWKTDGTAAGTVLVKNIDPVLRQSSNPAHFTVFNNGLYFQADDGVNGMELWRSEGNADDTLLLKDINSGGSSSPSQFALYRGALYFAADGGNGVELWKTDATATGTVLVKDINVSGSSNPTDLVVVNDVLYFKANDGVNGVELWKTDGTTGGTQILQDTCPGACSGIAVAE